MATHIMLQFNDGEILSLSTSSFLFKQSKLLQSIDIDEDNTIPILCSHSYVLDENDIFLFNDKTDLSFMFTLLPNKFIEVCKFLDIICYENEDTLFSKQFITYIMTNIKEEINIIKYFMQPETRSIMNFLNNECINLQIKSCTPAFYALYLTEYKEDVIKRNRIDIFELSTDKSEYYRYIHKYDNHLTYFVKETHEYKDYTVNISKQLNIESKRSNNINNIKELVEQGANVNFKNQIGRNTVSYASELSDNLEVIKYLIEQGANIFVLNRLNRNVLHIASDVSNNLEVIQYLIEHITKLEKSHEGIASTYVNLRDTFGYTALHIAATIKYNTNVVQYLVEHGADINLQNNDGNTALHCASEIDDNIEVIRCIVSHIVKINNKLINIQNNDGCTALHCASEIDDNIEVIRCIVSHIVKINNKLINIQNNDGCTALHFASCQTNNFEVIKYLVEQGANIHLPDNYGDTALHHASSQTNNLEVIKYLVKQGADIHLQDNDENTALYIASRLYNNEEVINYLQNIIQQH